MSNKKSKYEEYVLPRLEDIKAWARDGVIEEDIAKRLGIAYSTFRKYKNEKEALSAALKRGKEVYDNEVVEALHKNTLGGIVKVKKAIKLKERIYDKGKLIKEVETVKLVDEEIYVKPDTLAQIYWLKNRIPDRWRDNPVIDDDEQANARSESVTALIDALKNREGGYVADIE